MNEDLGTALSGSDEPETAIIVPFCKRAFYAHMKGRHEANRRYAALSRRSGGSMGWVSRVFLKRVLLVERLWMTWELKIFVLLCSAHLHILKNKIAVFRGNVFFMQDGTRFVRKRLWYQRTIRGG